MQLHAIYFRFLSANLMSDLKIVKMTKKVYKERGVLLKRIKSGREMVRKNNGLRVVRTHSNPNNVTNQK